MFCETCRHMLLHRNTPDPRASRCTNPECARVLDAAGRESEDDPGPWPTQEEIDELKGMLGTHMRHDAHGNLVASWSYRRGTSATSR